MNISDFKDDIVFFDIDGVLAKYDFKNGIKIYDEHDWIKLNMQTNPYLNIECTSFFNDFIKEKSDIHTLSVAYSNYEIDNKIQFLQLRHPNIERKNMHFVADGSYKIMVLKQIYRDSISLYSNNSKKRLVLIEDSVQVMNTVEKANNPYIKCYLVSDFL